MRGLRGLVSGLAALAAVVATAPDAVRAETGGGRILLVPLYHGAEFRPKPRPARGTEVLSTAGVILSPRPEARPGDLARRYTVRVAGIRTQPVPETTIGRAGRLCGSAGIKGVKLAPIAGRLMGCGLADPVSVTSVRGVRLTQAAVMDCPTAKALESWVGASVLPTVGERGGGVAALRVAAHYSCRTRNNRPGAKISEHGRGRAIDISAIVLRDGRELSVLRDWDDGRNGRLLRAMHRGACGPFGTVLGPEADRYHRDHLHLDTARYRSGPYCR